MRSRVTLLLASCLVVTQAFAGTITITPTTTLAAETANNTSTPNTFVGLPNGDPAGGNASKLPIRNLVPGFNGKILAHYMPWWGKPGHIDIGQSSQDPVQAERIVTDMISRGYDGMMVSEANSNTYNQNGALTMFGAVQNHPGFLFSISENYGAFSGSTDPTAKLIADMSFSYYHYFQSPDYLRVNGRPVVFIFDQNITGLDWAKAKANSLGNPLFVFRNRSGFGYSYSDGAFSWIGLPTTTDLTGYGYLDDFYSLIPTYSTKLAVGSAWKGFNDTVASWSKNRVVSQQCGTVWLDTFGRTTNVLLNPPSMLKVATWNDYEEGTEVETGIDNCARMSASVTSGVLNFAPVFSDPSGSERTVDSYSVFISTDGQNLMKLIDLPAGSRTLNLSTYSLQAGTYSVYVKMNGQPHILNRMSPAATYTVAPYAKVTITSPTNGYPNAGQYIRVKGYATTNTPVTTMAITVDGVVAYSVKNVTSVDKYVYGKLHKWHTVQVLAYTNGAWVKSNTAKVYVSY
jgi:hypothetical protein